MTRLDISVAREPRGRGPDALHYHINGEPVGTLLREVAKRIRSRIAVPNKLIKEACLRAKEAECEMRIWFTGENGWAVRRKL